MKSVSSIIFVCTLITVSTAGLVSCTKRDVNRLLASVTTPTASVLFYFGGYDAGFAPSKKVYVSKDNGITWGEVGTDALNLAVTASMCFYHDNKIWVVGGRDAAAAIDDVQSSSDGGQTWTTHSNVLPTILQGSTFGKLGSSLYVIGGVVAANAAVIYSSTNGSTWTNPGAVLSSVAGAIHSSVVFNNKIWVAGGQTPAFSNTVYTFDGSTVVTSPAGGLSNLPVSDDWLSGYTIGSKLYFANGTQILSTIDGSSWVNETTVNSKSLPINSGFGHQILSHSDGAIYLIGGFVAALQNGVYKSTDGVDWTTVGTLPEVRASGCALSATLPQTTVDAL